ncbi:MAG: hypothetical protein AB2392_16405 [Neobacillus sp.]
MEDQKQSNLTIEKANERMSEPFQNYSYRATTEAHSEADAANEEIQKQFYENDEQNNFLPFYIDSNSPPIKK